MHTQIGIVMGSRSEWSTIQHTANTLAQLGIAYEARIVTAYRNTNQLQDYAAKAKDRGLEIIIAGLSDGANLPGILASKANMPVLGVPIQTKSLKLKNTKQSKSNASSNNSIEIPVTGSDSAEHAALLAASMLCDKYPKIRDALTEYRRQQQPKKTTEENSRHVA